MSKFLSLVEENTPNNTPEVDEYTKEGLEQLEGYMAQVELNLGYAGELLVDLNDPIVEKRAGELGAKIQEDLHNFMDNFGGTSVEEDAESGAFNRLEGLYNTDLMKTFIECYHDLVADIQKEEPFETEDIVEFLTHKMNEFKPEELPAEDYEFTDKSRQKKVDRFDSNRGNISGVLSTANELRAADPDPARPSRGVQQVNKAVDGLGKAVVKNIKRVTKMIK